MLHNLVYMGIESEIALLALKHTQYENDNRALAFIVDKDIKGKFEHPWMENGQSGICYICFEGSEVHYMDENGTESDDSDVSERSMPIEIKSLESIRR